MATGLALFPSLFGWTMKDALMILVVAAACSAHAADLSGKWVGTIEMPPEKSLSLVIENQGGVLRGKVSFGTEPNASFIGNIEQRESTLSFTTTYAHFPMQFNLNITSAKLDGYALYGETWLRVHLGGPVVRFPKVLKRREPEYTEEARSLKNEGVVAMRVTVDTKGRPTAFRVLRHLGNGLDEKAIEAVKQWRFRPGSSRGIPVAMETTVEVEFRLHN